MSLYSGDSRRKGSSGNSVNCLIKQFLQHIIYSNWVIGISAGVLCAGWTYHQGFENSALYGFTTLFASIAVYNFQRLYKLSSISSRSPWLDWVEINKKYITFLTICSFLIAAAGFLYLIENVLLVLACLVLTGAISFFYVVPIFGKSIRDIPGIKSFIIAIVWVLILFVLPAINEGQFTVKVIPELIAYFLFFVALTIPFDIRDLKYDKPIQKTLPQVLGINGSKFLAIFLIVIFCSTLILLKESIHWNPFFIGIVILAILLVLGTNESRKEGYYALIDCVMILVGLVYFL